MEALVSDVDTLADPMPIPSTPATGPSHTLPHNIPHPQAPTVLPQIAEAARQLAGGPVELTLNPEELGTVRLSLSSTDTGMVVQVIADRPETLDLLRRHIQDLAQDFRDIGHGDVAFSFSGGASQDNAPSPRQDQTDTHPQTAETDPATQPHQIHLGAGQGLDLRL